MASVSGTSFDSIVERSTHPCQAIDEQDDFMTAFKFYLNERERQFSEFSVFVC